MMTTLAELEKVKAVQVTIDKMLKGGSMNLLSAKAEIGKEFWNKWVLEPVYKGEDCSLGFVHCAKVELGACDAHVHPNSREYLIVVQGKILFNLEGRDLRIVREGECCFVDAGVMHYSKPLVDNTKMVYICVPEDSTIPALEESHG